MSKSGGRPPGTLELAEDWLCALALARGSAAPLATQQLCARGPFLLPFLAGSQGPLHFCFRHLFKSTPSPTQNPDAPRPRPGGDRQVQSTGSGTKGHGPGGQAGTRLSPRAHTSPSLSDTLTTSRSTCCRALAQGRREALSPRSPSK